MKTFVIIAGICSVLSACQQLGKDDTETAVAEQTREQAIAQADRHYNKAVLKDPTIANRHFQRAAEDFKAGKYVDAAVQIREGAGAWYKDTAAIDEFARGEPVPVDTFGLKADSARVAIETLTVSLNEVRDADTAYQAVPPK